MTKNQSLVTWIPKGILFFGATEIAIGTITLIAHLTASTLTLYQKPLNVLTFVIVTAIISVGLGIGILIRNIHARHMLVFFATMIILSKILIFAGIISLSGALESNIPDLVKNTISLLYHAAILVYFNLPKVKEKFR